MCVCVCGGMIASGPRFVRTRQLLAVVSHVSGPDLIDGQISTCGLVPLTAKWSGRLAVVKSDVLVGKAAFLATERAAVSNASINPSQCQIDSIWSI